MMVYKIVFNVYLAKINIFFFKFKVGSEAGSGSDFFYQLEKNSDPHPWFDTGLSLVKIFICAISQPPLGLGVKWELGI